jgi:Tol biopolymer transport system component
MQVVMLFCSLSLIPAATAQAPSQANTNDDVTAAVARMARVGSAGSAHFSPDGKWISFLSNMSGSPQVWVMPADGGYPRMITNGDDPVTQAEWSPGSEWIAVTIAPGGGLNTQVYVVKADGTGMKRLTSGGQENNSFDAWMHNSRYISIDSNRDNPAARDNFLVDIYSGDTKLLARNPGIGNISNISDDGKRALLSRLKNRGDNNLYLLDMESGKDTLITKHEGVAQFFGELAPDGKTVYIGTNKDRDLTAFARVRVGADGVPGPIEILEEHPDRELDSMAINKQGTMAALHWNMKGRSEFTV